ncbi:pol polyprotein [Acanthamoeba castellanii str. Neff]|uniref:Pol polyprotein n=1 Tax=Acanthamoeba castellanii (strain ATCC 30010 / Neff) TaxID=1257118 RepID=L8GQT9_ACACF|nr:pol polyprotein [Acanthamoeba castellanii str. Neff]ELR15360.1 pol polyprotein [Acanthamoeba castellanii str. Neff]
MVGSVWRLSLDFISGYWQIPVHKDNIEKTAFMTQHSTFKFTVMPFRLTNTPASFQRDMDIVLSGLNWVSTLVYINDIIVFSVSFKDHLQHLQEVFDQLRTTNMFMKPSKCNFCWTELPFLRHLMQKDGIAMDPKKVRVMHEMAWPVNTTKPFHGVVWMLECEVAFIWLKEALTMAPVLTFPDFKRPFYLHTNTLKLAIGAVLSQWTEEGNKQVVAYTNQQLSKSEHNYNVTEWECLSIMFWIEYFHHYLHSSKFHVVTDHTALKWLMDVKEQRGQLAQWAMKLQPYDFEIVYHAGIKHINTHTMTRPPIMSNTDIMAMVSETRAKQAAAIKGDKFMQWVVTNPFGDVACAAILAGALVNLNGITVNLKDLPVAQDEVKGRSPHGAHQHVKDVIHMWEWNQVNPSFLVTKTTSDAHRL